MERSLYLIRSEDGYYKIGISTNPQRRLRDLQVANPHKLEIVGVIDKMDKTLKNRFEANTISKLEWELQKRLDRFHVRREWFKFDKGQQQNIVMFFNGRYGANLFKERESVPDFDDWRDYIK